MEVPSSTPCASGESDLSVKKKPPKMRVMIARADPFPSPAFMYPCAANGLNT